MRTITLTLPRYHPAQRTIANDPTRFRVIAAGRRFGKDVLMNNLLIDAAIHGHPVGFGAPVYKTLQEDWRAVQELLAPVIVKKSEQERRLDLVSGGSVEFWSLDNPDAIRGRRYKRFVINEAGFVPNLMDIWNFILRPTLIDFQGDAVVGGTPKGRNGFWQMQQWGIDPAQPDWKFHHYTTFDNPHIPRAEVEELVHNLPERVARQEIYAEFIEDAGGVFRKVMQAATAVETGPQPGRSYSIGVDWGRTNDSTVFSVLDIEARSQVSMTRLTDTNYDLQFGALLALAEKYMPLVIVPEYNSMGGPMVERLHGVGLPVRQFNTTSATKQMVIDALALEFERETIRILPDPVQVGELQAYEQERLTSGAIRYGAPEGLHDDTVMALALALHGCGQTTGVRLVDWV